MRARAQILTSRYTDAQGQFQDAEQSFYQEASRITGGNTGSPLSRCLLSALLPGLRLWAPPPPHTGPLDVSRGSGRLGSQEAELTSPQLLKI
jgi:hypothetical protein